MTKLELKEIIEKTVDLCNLLLHTYELVLKSRLYKTSDLHLKNGLRRTGSKSLTFSKIHLLAAKFLPFNGEAFKTC